MLLFEWVVMVFMRGFVMVAVVLRLCCRRLLSPELRVLLGDALVLRLEALASAAPRRPELDDDKFAFHNHTLAHLTLELALAHHRDHRAGRVRLSTGWANQVDEGPDVEVSESVDGFTTGVALG